jgi:hypothetical protein
VLAEVWLGRRPLLDAVRAGLVDVVGSGDVVSRLMGALQLSPMADTVRRSMLAAAPG